MGRAISWTIHIRQSLQTMQFYIDDHEGMMLVRSKDVAPVNRPWALRLKENNYLANPDIAICPAGTPSKWDDSADSWLLYTFGMPRRPDQWGAYLGTNIITIPSGETDGGTSVINFYAMTSMKLVLGDSFSTGTNSQHFEWAVSGGNLMAFNHGGRGNMGWSDGHVTSMTPQEVKDETKSVVKVVVKNGVKITL